MCEDQVEFLRHAEVLVIGHTGAIAAGVLAAAEPRHVVVDLTRGQVNAQARPALTAA
jgi:predicted amino acid dehydrogenase